MQRLLLFQQNDSGERKVAGIRRHGGDRFDIQIETIEGDRGDSTLIALISFPTRAALEAFASDPDYQPWMIAVTYEIEKRQATPRPRYWPFPSGKR